MYFRNELKWLLLLHAVTKNHQHRITAGCEFSLTPILVVSACLSPTPMVTFPTPVGVFLLYLHHRAAGSCQVGGVSAQQLQAHPELGQPPCLQVSSQRRMASRPD